ncbi:MAG: type IV secretion system protein [Alphaproteobacteria bacterium]|nr:type IV secretion system protein [Alphaproteobacteria bacterium]
MLERLRMVIILGGVVAIFLYLLSVLFGLICSYNSNFGSCWSRYGGDVKAPLMKTHSSVQTVSLKSTGNYINALQYDTDGNPTLSTDNSHYGQWLDAGGLSGPDVVHIKIEGEVSLCNAYLPDYNIQDGTLTANRKILIPRVGNLSSGPQSNSDYLSLQFPANSPSWRNAFYVHQGDKVLAFVGEPVMASNTIGSVSSMTMYNPISQTTTIPADCSSNVISNVNPVCGRAGLNGFGYTNSCTKSVQCIDIECKKYLCYKEMDNPALSSPCTAWLKPNGEPQLQCSANDCYDDLGDRYWFSGNTILPPFNTETIYFYQDHLTSDGVAPPKNMGDFFQGATVIDCNQLAVDKGYIEPDGWNKNQQTVEGYRAKRGSYGAYAANGNVLDESKRNPPVPSSFSVPAPDENLGWLIEGDGLLMQYSTSSGAPSAVTTTSRSTQIMRTRGILESSGSIETPGKILLSEVISAENAPSSTGSYLQLSYMQNSSPVDASKNTGGYVLHLQQSACVRTNGAFVTDTYQNRGQIYYYILPSSYDMNNLPTDDPEFSLANYPGGPLILDSAGSADIAFDRTIYETWPDLHLWLIVKNDPADYVNSYGDYTVSIRTDTRVGAFSQIVLQPLFDIITTYTENVAMQIVKSSICYQQSDKSACADFFMYIKALLCFYIMIAAVSFMFGFLQMNAQVFFTHLMKIVIVGGMTNDITFGFFSSNLKDLLLDFVDGVMCNLGNGSGTNAFNYLDDLYSRILLNPMTYLQLMAIISFGLSGLLNFVLVFASLILMFLANAIAISAYIFAKFMLAFLVSIGPLFISFSLFNFSRNLFEGWINQIAKALIEPILICTGMAIFTKLIVVYIDKVLAYSVCFKCAMPFTVGSVGEAIYPTMPAAFKNIEIFCLYWFTPWGMSSNLGVMSLSFSDILALLLLGLFSYSYVSVASSVAQEITGAHGFSAGVTSVQSMQKPQNLVSTAAKYAASGSYQIGKAGISSAYGDLGGGRIPSASGDDLVHQAINHHKAVDQAINHQKAADQQMRRRNE